MGQRRADRYDISILIDPSDSYTNTPARRSFFFFLQKGKKDHKQVFFSFFLSNPFEDGKRERKEKISEGERRQRKPKSARGVASLPLIVCPTDTLPTIAKRPVIFLFSF